MFLTPPALRATSPSKGRGGAADAHNQQKKLENLENKIKKN